MAAGSTPARAIGIDDVKRAAQRLKGASLVTPVITNPVVDEWAGCEVFMKAENLQVTGAFKFRGAYNAVSALSAEELSNGVVAFSSGNHAQAVALAATMCGSSATIVMPSDAPAEKIAGTKANGASVVHYDRYEEDRDAIAAEIAADEQRALIVPYDNPLVIAGQGTAGLELTEQVADLDALFVCVGGGGLLAGCATVFEALSSATKIYGVEPAAGNDHALSQAAGERVRIDIPRTIADGQQVAVPGELTWPINDALVEAFPLVSDDEIVATMRLLFDHAKLVVEPSGASALAAVLHRKDLGLEGKRVAVTLSGGNIGFDRFQALLGD